MQAAWFNSSQGKVPVALFRLKDAIHQHVLALDVIQVLNGLAKLNTIACMCTDALSRTASS